MCPKTCFRSREPAGEGEQQRVLSRSAGHLDGVEPGLQFQVDVGEERTVFTDDAFPAFLRGAYVRYARPATSMHRTLPVQVDAVRLLTEAKRLCAEAGGLQEGARDAGAIR